MREPFGCAVVHPCGGPALAEELLLLPRRRGESVVLRVLDRSNVQLSLDRVGLRDDDLEKVRGLISKPNGIMLVTGPTGSGKTLAFGLPLVATVDKAAPKRPRALVLAPTRELALQIFDVLRVVGSKVRGPHYRARSRGGHCIANLLTVSPPPGSVSICSRRGW